MPSTGGSDPNGGGDSGVGGAASGAGASGAGGSAGASGGVGSGGYGGTDPSNQGVVNGPGDVGQGFGVGPDGMGGYTEGDPGNVGDGTYGYSSAVDNAEAAKAGFLGALAGLTNGILGGIVGGIKGYTSDVKGQLTAGVKDTAAQYGVSLSDSQISGIVDGLVSQGTTGSGSAGSGSTGASTSGEGGRDTSITPTVVETIISDVTSGSTNTSPAQGTWSDYVNKFFGTEEGMKSAKTMLQEQANYVAQQFETWLKDSTSNTDTYTDQLGTYTKKQNSLLDDLIDQSKEGTGLFSPIKFKLAGQEIEFVPKAQRAQADQMAGFGQTSLANSTGMLDNILNAKQTQAKNALTNSQAGAPNNGELAYLDQLRQMAQTSEEAALAREAIASKEGMASDQLKANEPGVFDYLKAGSSLLSGVGDVYNAFSD